MQDYVNLVEESTTAQNSAKAMRHQDREKKCEKSMGPMRDAGRAGANALVGCMCGAGEAGKR